MCCTGIIYTAKQDLSNCMSTDGCMHRFGTKEGLHLLMEVMKLGFEDRNTYTGDPVCDCLLV